MSAIAARAERNARRGSTAVVAVGRQRRPHRTGVGDVERGPDVDLDDACPHRGAQRLVGHPRGTVQYQRHRHRVAQRRDEVDVEFGGAGGHGVGAADRDGEGVNPCRADEFGGLPWVGAHAGGMRVGHLGVLAADVSELRLDRQPPLVQKSGGLGRHGDVAVVGQGAAVDHHRGVPGRRRPTPEIGRFDVVQMQAHRHLGIGRPGRPARRSADAARRETPRCSR